MRALGKLGSARSSSKFGVARGVLHCHLLTAACAGREDCPNVVKRQFLRATATPAPLSAALAAKAKQALHSVVRPVLTAQRGATRRKSAHSASCMVPPAIAVVAIALLTAFAVEAVQWALVYRTDTFQQLKRKITLAEQRLEVRVSLRCPVVRHRRLKRSAHVLCALVQRARNTYRRCDRAGAAARRRAGRRRGGTSRRSARTCRQRARHASPPT